MQHTLEDDGPGREPPVTPLPSMMLFCVAQRRKAARTISPSRTR
jgi:hypothetical protein